MFSSFYISVLALAALPVLAYCIWSAISTARTPQGAVAWTVFLISAPWFAVPVYIVVGRRKLTDYEAAWRKSHTVVSAQFNRCRSRSAAQADVHRGLERIGGFPFAAGNDVALLVDGAATFDTIIAGIDAARSTIHVQFYIVRNDGLGQRFARALTRALARGVAVWVIYDGVGSQKLPVCWAERLRGAGAQVINPETTRGPSSRLNINFRNHRKTVILDGLDVFIGGHNIGDEYLGLDAKIGHWRDTHIHVRGPVAAQALAVYAEDWHWATGEALADLHLDTPGPAHCGTQTVALVPTGPGDAFDSGSLMFFTAITAAKERVWIASPYFVPDTDILTALIAAALAGRDVRLILPAQIDHYLPWLAAHAYFDEIREAGVRIYRYTDGFMHQKVILIDDHLSAVGTANLDNRSFRLNFESMVFVDDPRFARNVADMLEIDMARSTFLSRSLSAHPLTTRIGAPLARLLAPIL